MEVRNVKHHVVYLTGAPACGKSTLMSALAAAVSPLITFSYSKELAEFVSRRDSAVYLQDEMRRKSSAVIGPEDVDAVDASLVKLVIERRADSHIIIDSHAVTKEPYGFRVTPFRLSRLEEIQPTLIFVLYASAEIIRARIQADPAGRPLPSVFDATFHNELQGSVALIYGIHVGVPVYFLDSSQPVATLVTEVQKRLQR